MKKVNYFIREADEDLLKMIKNHEEPYTNFQNALRDARDMMIDEPDLELEIVQVLIEDITPVTIKRVK